MSNRNASRGVGKWLIGWLVIVAPAWGYWQKHSVIWAAGYLLAAVLYFNTFSPLFFPAGQRMEVVRLSIISANVVGIGLLVAVAVPAARRLLHNLDPGTFWALPSIVAITVILAAFRRTQFNAIERSGRDE